MNMFDINIELYFTDISMGHRHVLLRDLNYRDTHLEIETQSLVPHGLKTSPFFSVLHNYFQRATPI